MSRLKSVLSQLKAQKIIRDTPFINGIWLTRTNTRKTFPVHCPYSGELLSEVQEVDEEDIDQAIHNATVGFQKWKSTSCRTRSELLRSLYNNVISRGEEIATVCSMESGKPIIESRGEVKYAASFLEWFSEESKRTFGDVIPKAESNIRRYVVKQPVGVAGLITPWNFPIAMITRKLGAALAAGCTVLIKPAEDTPLSALALAQMADEVGFPPGVINVLPCSRSFACVVGDRFCNDQRIQKISFTGSTEVGKYLMEKCARTVKRTCMELGGSAPFIVFDSADVDIAVKAAMVAKFRNNGQTCIGADRFLVQSEIHDVFVNKFCTALQSLVVGSPLDDATTLGTLVNERVLTKVKEHVEDALAKGGTLVAGGTEGRGLVYEPTIVQNCTTDMKIMSEETFGPVAAIMRFDNEEEAIAIANNSKNGLAAYICTSDYRQQWRVGEQVDVGMLGINEGLISADVVPFGGMKESGFGREGSVYGIDEYLEMKYLCFGEMD